MSEMVEKVARAVGLSLDENRPWEECGPGFREICFDVARAAIEAMREPTPGVMSHVKELHGFSDASIYRRFIDAALKD